MTTDSTEFLVELAGVVPRGLFTDPVTLQGYRHDEAATVEHGMPAAVVLPRTVGEVQSIVRLAARHRIPIVPRGAGSGLSGGANAIDGCLILSLERMNRLVALDVDNLYAVVEPGVINAELSAAAKAVGLHYAPDPASHEFSTLGGNVATNAGGLCCVKYGVTRDSVLGLELVLADGSVVRTGRKTLKGVAGYDLTGLFVGSEGTLGVITQATLRLRPMPHPAATLIAFFPTLRAAGAATTEIRRLLVPSLLELLDQVVLTAVEDWRNLGLDTSAAAMLVAQSDAGSEASLREVAAMRGCCERHGATFTAETADALETEIYLSARKLAFPALQRRGATLLDDVAVPCARIPDLLQAIQAIAETHEVLIGTFGHAGDGNMHPTIIFDGDDPSATAAVTAAFDDIVRTALDLGGTVTGEHGVGRLKRSHLRGELGDTGLQLQRSIKRLLDPLDIMNPGKVL